MVRKRSQKTLTNLLDAVVSEIVRSRGYCMKCWKKRGEVQLQPAHIVGRSNFAVRWELLNILCLCAKCHFWGHNNPLLFRDLVYELLGEEGVAELQKKARVCHVWTVDEKEELLATLKKMLERIKDGNQDRH